MFEKLKFQVAHGSFGYRTLFPTRWTVRASSLECMLSNFEVFRHSGRRKTGADAHTHISGVQFQITTFNYLFGITLGELILKHTNNSQNPKLAAADVHSIAEHSYM